MPPVSLRVAAVTPLAADDTFVHLVSYETTPQALRSLASFQLFQRAIDERVREERQLL